MRSMIVKGKVGSWANKWKSKSTLGKNLVETNSSLSERAGKTNPLEMNTQSFGEKGGIQADRKTYQTYTKTNLMTDEVYSGRTSGIGTPAENIRLRDSKHHMNDKGFGPAVLDVSSANKAAIRGCEQILIDLNGGAKSIGGISGNAINGISINNPKR
jgi:hypothetical protein